MKKKILLFLLSITVVLGTACSVTNVPSDVPNANSSQDSSSDAASNSQSTDDKSDGNKSDSENTDDEKDVADSEAPGSIEKRIEAAGQKYLDFLGTDTPVDMIANTALTTGTTKNGVGAALDALEGALSNFMGSTDEMASAELMEAPVMSEEATFVDDFAINAEQTQFNRESYKDIKESGFISTKAQPFSTFGADVDTATYSNLRRKIFDNIYYQKMRDESGYESIYGYSGIDDNAVRIEEMINYFDYSYKAPEDGDKFGVDIAYTDCPWNEDTELLRIGIKAEDALPAKGSNIVFLIDTSGSMFDFDKLPLVQKSFNILQEQLGKNDRISIVTYAGTEEVVAEGLSGDEHQKIKAAIDSLEAYGATNGEGGINKAYEIAEKYFIEGGNNRVILATDGDLNVGVSSEAGLIDLIEKKKKSGVFLSCLGFGTGNYQDDKMEALADKGNGNYAYIDCENEAKKVLQKELWSNIYTVAKDAKFQVEFNPEMVKGYRLIGYENRAMAAEDFADDTKDGGEVGAGQTVTVLYEIVPVDSEYDVPVVTSRYNHDTEDVDKDKENADEDPSVKSDELLAVNLRYKEPDADKSELRVYPVTKDMKSDKMDDDTSWAAGVAQFGMLIRDSAYKGTSTYVDIYGRLADNPKVMDDDFMAEFLYMVKKMGKDELNAGTDSDTHTDTDDMLADKDSLEYTAIYDKQSYDSAEAAPCAKIIDSQEKLKAYAANSYYAIEDLAKDKDFFDKKVVLYAAVPVGTGSATMMIGDIISNDVLTMYIDQEFPEVGTTDMVTWHIFAIVDKDKVSEDIIKGGKFNLVVDGGLIYSTDTEDYQDIYGVGNTGDN